MTGAQRHPLLQPTAGKVVLGVLLGGGVLVALALATRLPLGGLALPSFGVAYVAGALLLRFGKTHAAQGLFGPTVRRVAAAVGVFLVLGFALLQVPDLPREGGGHWISSRAPLLLTMLVEQPLPTLLLLVTLAYTLACGLSGLRHAGRAPEAQRGATRRLAAVTVGLDALVLVLLALAYLRARAGA